MKIYNDSSLHNVLKNAASKKLISNFDLDSLKTSITNIYNSAVSIGILSKEQTTNIIYQIETGGKVKNFIPSNIDKECIKSIIDIHNKVNKKAPQIKNYTMLLNSINIDENKNNSKTREIKEKEKLIEENGNLLGKIKKINSGIEITIKSHTAYIENLITQLKNLKADTSIKDEQEKYNAENLILSNFITKNELPNLDKANLLETKKYIEKAKEYDEKSNNIIKGLMDITSIYKGYLDKDLKPITTLNAENILNMINKHINKIEKINSNNL